MPHVVTSEPHICPSCKKSNMGATYAIYDYCFCPSCWYGKLDEEIHALIKEWLDKKFKDS